MKKRLQIQNLTISDISSKGLGIGKQDEMVYFVNHAIPGDVVDIEITKKKSNYREGQIIAITHPSKDRITAKCTHFGTCGGCKWQHLGYETQSKYKEQMVFNALERIGKIENVYGLPIIPSDFIWAYRNKMEYTFSNKKWLTNEEIKSGADFDRDAVGFHISGAFDKVLHVDKCYLQDDLSNRIRQYIFDFAKENLVPFYDIKNHTGVLRNLIVRLSGTTNDKMIVLSVAQFTDAISKLLGLIQIEFPELTSIQYVVNSKKNDTISDLDVETYYGSDFITEKIEDVLFYIGPKSFYQTNSLQTLKLYNVIRDFADLKPTDSVFDLYTGVGTIALFLAKNVKQVLGIEYLESAVVDAQNNARQNNIENAFFLAGDMKALLTDGLIEKYFLPDIIILDPPRAGIDKEVIDQLLKIKAPSIVYVSCNVGTQARDLELLSSLYQVEKTQPVDMFPHTIHVESVVKLILKS